MITVHNGGPLIPSHEGVLFAFDDHAFPFRRHLALHLVRGDTPGGKGRGNIVLPHGPKGGHDEGVHFYGTIRPIGDTLHMWYIGRQGESKAINREGGIGRICYATSTDGVHWTKPELGLAEHNGSKRNNLVRLRGGTEETCIDSLTVQHAPDDPDPSRRFKMVYQATGGPPRPPMRVAFSADGLDWQPSKRNPVGPYLEW